MESRFGYGSFRFHKIGLVFTSMWPCENCSLHVLFLHRFLVTFAATACMVGLALGIVWLSLLFISLSIGGLISFFYWFFFCFFFAFRSWWTSTFEPWRLLGGGFFSFRTLSCTWPSSFSDRFSSIFWLWLVYFCQINWDFLRFWLFQKSFSLLYRGIHRSGSMQFLFFWNFRQFRWTIHLIVPFF